MERTSNITIIITNYKKKDIQSQSKELLRLRNAHAQRASAKREVSMKQSKYLEDVAPEKAFWFRNGMSVRNVYELVREIKAISEADFQYHCTKDHDDFANWIGGVVGDIELSSKLRSIKHRQMYIAFIERRINKLEKKTIFERFKREFIQETKDIIEQTGILWKIGMTIAIIVIIMVVYLQFESAKNIEQTAYRVYLLEQKGQCFDTYLQQQIFQTQDMITSTNRSIVPPTCLQEYGASVGAVEDVPEMISKGEFSVYNDRVVIMVNNASWAIFTNSSSMIPTITHNTKSIEVKPQNESEIHIGDIISYSDGPDIIAHRVVDIQYDNAGIYYITKGDHNSITDPARVRFSQVKGIVVALIY